MLLLLVFYRGDGKCIAAALGEYGRNAFWLSSGVVANTGKTVTDLVDYGSAGRSPSDGAVLIVLICHSGDGVLVADRVAEPSLLISG